MKKTLMLILMLLLVVGCSDSPPDYNTYQSQPQDQQYVGGGCGLSPQNPNILGTSNIEVTEAL